jgi:hypothetical protein
MALIVFYSRSPLGQLLLYNTGDAVKDLTDVYYTIVFVISLRFVHN